MLEGYGDQVREITRVYLIRNLSDRVSSNELKAFDGFRQADSVRLKVIGIGLENKDMVYTAHFKAVARSALNKNVVEPIKICDHALLSEEVKHHNPCKLVRARGDKGGLVGVTCCFTLL
jgi:hypothetical protein